MAAHVTRAHLPFLFVQTPAAAALLGRHASEFAVLAMKAALKNQRSAEIAHQQFRFRGHDLVFSSHVNGRGELVITIDIGDPALADRLILEEDLRRAVRAIPRVKGLNP